MGEAKRRGLRGSGGFSVDWVPIADHLPDLYEYVFLLCEQCWNAPDEAGNPPVIKVGYLHNFGGDYWSVFGERAHDLNAFTHWCRVVLPEDGEPK